MLIKIIIYILRIQFLEYILTKIKTVYRQFIQHISLKNNSCINLKNSVIILSLFTNQFIV